MKPDFDNIFICVKSEIKYNIHKFWDLRRYLTTKNDYFERQANKFSHISEMNITFISDPRNLTYEHYPKQQKSMLESKLDENLSRNPEPQKTLGNISHPLFRKYKCKFPPQENQDLRYIISNNLI